MTKKTTEFVAKEIRLYSYYDANNFLCLDDKIIESFLLYFKKQNKNFDEKRFLDACNLEWETKNTKDGGKINFKLKIKEPK